MVRLGPVTLTGSAAIALLLVVLVGIIAAIVHYRAQIFSSPLTISAVLWIAFVIYWSFAARNTAATTSRESPQSRRVHQLFLNGALLLVFVPIPGLDRRMLPAGSWLVPLGLAVHVGSFLLAVSARRHLGRFWSAEITQKADHQLVRTGPYRFVRHPIYTAILGMFVGMAIVSGDVHAFIAVAMILFAYWRKIRLEEQNLVEVFGATYDDYRRTTRALVPWLM